MQCFYARLFSYFWIKEIMALLMDPAFCIDEMRKHRSTQDVAEVCPQRQPR